MHSVELQQVETGTHAPFEQTFLPAVPRLVSQPFDGSPSQSAKPLVQVSVQLALQLPLMALQQVVPLHTLLPVLSVYEQLPPTPLQLPAVR